MLGFFIKKSVGFEVGFFKVFFFNYVVKTRMNYHVVIFPQSNNYRHVLKKTVKF